MSTKDLLADLVASGPLPRPGSGATRARFGSLAEASRRSLSLGRLYEAHADAVAILDEAGMPPGDDDVLMGVWASDRNGAVRVEGDGTDRCLVGTKPFCSGAPLLDRALVTAASGTGLELALVELDHPGVHVEPSTWVGPGMRATETRAVRFDEVTCTLVGPTDWYLARAGFWHGAVGVAASWFGGALGVVDTLAHGVDDDPHALSLLGEADAIRYSMESALWRGADEIDMRPDAVGEARGRALRIRRVVASGCLDVLTRANEALGPRALAHDEDHSGRAADLEVYVRQEHGRHDSEQIGRSVTRGTRC